MPGLFGIVRSEADSALGPAFDRLCGEWLPTSGRELRSAPPLLVCRNTVGHLTHWAVVPGGKPGTVWNSPQPGHSRS